jgi:hypothetical protein
MNGYARRRRYERSTPVGRAEKNLVKISRIGQLTLERLRSWIATPLIDEDLDKAIAWLSECVAAAEETSSRVRGLMERGWSPPKRSSSVVYARGDHVRVNEKYRSKYLEIYALDVIHDLVVSKILPSGEVVVQHGRATPFIVAKSHLERMRDEEEAAE